MHPDCSSSFLTSFWGYYQAPWAGCADGQRTATDRDPRSKAQYEWWILIVSSPDVVIRCHFFVLPLKGPGKDNKYIKILSNLQTKLLSCFTCWFTSLCVLYIINIYCISTFVPPAFFSVSRTSLGRRRSQAYYYMWQEILRTALNERLDQSDMEQRTSKENTL